MFKTLAILLIGFFLFVAAQGGISFPPTNDLIAYVFMAAVVIGILAYIVGGRK